jgi:two-component sensor histidine kinase
VALPTEQIVPLGLIVAELVANAAKHGAGGITVSLSPVPEGGWSLSVSDEGGGLPADFDPATTTGFGMRVISTLVGQLHGRLSFGGNGGQGVSITMLFPPFKGGESSGKPHAPVG